MTGLKQALTYDEQVSCLIGHNLTVNDRAKAIAVLKEVNYYRLSAYGIGLTKTDDNNHYVDGVTFEDIYRLYCFDSRLRNILIHVIEQLEIQLRSQISNYLGLKYGPEGYVDPANFVTKFKKDGSNIHTTIIDKFRQECIHQSTRPFVKHHLHKYGGHFPIWVAVELFTFGNLSSLFDIMFKDDRADIARLYSTTSEYLSSWMLTLLEIRNISAHYGRLYNLPLKQSPYLYSENKKYKVGNITRLFPALITIKRMLKGDVRWQSFFSNLEALTDEYIDGIRLSYIGFPREWKTALRN